MIIGLRSASAGDVTRSWHDLGMQKAASVTRDPRTSRRGAQVVAPARTNER